jgi:hypothetical protein
MASPGMAAIHGRAARLHAELTQRLNTRAIFRYVGPNYLFARR